MRHLILHYIVFCFIVLVPKISDINFYKKQWRNSQSVTERTTLNNNENFELQLWKYSVMYVLVRSMVGLVQIGFENLQLQHFRIGYQFFLNVWTNKPFFVQFLKNLLLLQSKHCSQVNMHVSSLFVIKIIDILSYLYQNLVYVYVFAINYSCVVW